MTTDYIHLTLQNGYNVKFITIGNSKVYSEIAKSTVVEPKVPTYVDDRGRVLENPFSPKYHEALVVFQKRKELIVWESVLTNCVAFDDTWMETSDWAHFVKSYQRQKILTKIPIKIAFLKFKVFTQLQDCQYLARHALLTEDRVFRIFNTIRVTREATDINRVHLAHSVDTGIQTEPIHLFGYQIVNPLDEYTACIAANMNWSQWMRNEYDLDERATVIAFYRLDRIRNIHSEDAVQTEMERKAAKNKK